MINDCINPYSDKAHRGSIFLRGKTMKPYPAAFIQNSPGIFSARSEVLILLSDQITNSDHCILTNLISLSI